MSDGGRTNGLGTTPWPPRERPRPGPTPQRSGMWRVCAQTLLASWVVVGTVSIAFAVRVAFVADRLETRPTGALTDTYLGLMTPDNVLTAIRVAAFVLTAAALAVWSNGVRDLLRSRHRRLDGVEGQVAMWWFVPVANLAMPWVALARMWRATGPIGQPPSPVRIQLHLWAWGSTWGLAMLLTSGGTGVVSEQTPLTGLRTTAWLQAVGFALLVISAAIGALSVRRLGLDAETTEPPAEPPPVDAPTPSPVHAIDPTTPPSGRPGWLPVAGVATIAVAAIAAGLTAGMATAPAPGLPVVMAGGPQIDPADVTSVSTGELRSGMCIPAGADFGEVTITVATVRCETPHRYEVFALETVTGPSTYFDERRVVERAYGACLEAFEQDYGLDYMLSPVEVWPFYPTEQGWALGDRSVTCIVDTGSSIEGRLTADGAAGPLGHGHIMSVWALPTASCFKGDPYSVLVSRAECDAPHHWEVTAVVDVDEFPGEDEMEELLLAECPEAAERLSQERAAGTIGLWDGVYIDEATAEYTDIHRVICLVEKLA
jgi:hypothetical protein